MDIGTIKKKLKTSSSFGPTYRKLKGLRDELQYRHRIHGKYVFEDRAKGSDRLCIVLAGYKEYLYPAVMGRLKKYTPADMDVCIMTSGLYSEDAAKLCADNDWSYLSTKKNNVSLIQNIAIHLFPKAEYIFKLDEDIFITEGYFENMLRAYHHAEGGDYEPGIIAPIIPINPYGHLRVLEKFNQLETYIKLFEKPKYSCDFGKEFYKNPNAAKFFWGEGSYLPTIDEMNGRLSREPLQELPCAVRFSIGAIVFKRDFWELFGRYPVPLFGLFGGNVGTDETCICSFCLLHSRPVMVTENVVVGHLSFIPQNAVMKDYYLKHPEKFMPPNPGGVIYFHSNSLDVISGGAA